MPEPRTKVTNGTKTADKGRPSPSPSLKSLPSLPSAEREGFIPPHGGYQELLSYQKALVVYQATLHFCDRFIDKRSRTHDQMVQAARSGKQNILEGSQASGTSKETEIKFTNLARASQEELLEDYRDFMRAHNIQEWTPNHRYAQRLRRLNRTPGANYDTFKKGIEHPDPAICANVIVGLIKVTNYLLDQQLRRLEQDFLKEGGMRERMTRARLAVRAKEGGWK
ncbi:MAG: four helix bundle suffix domain-containing protein [Limisphaerales bacterium]